MHLLMHFSMHSSMYFADTFCGMHAGDWWKKLDNIIKLMQPISDAIHQLEADRPLLSQILGVWNSLIEHAETWAVGKAVALAKGVVSVFSARFGKHYQPEMAAACVLDPINFTQHGGDHYRPPLEGMTAQQREDIVATVMRLNGRATPATAVNAELCKLEMSVWDDDMCRRAEYLAEYREEKEENGRVKILVADTKQRRWFWLRAKTNFPLFATAANKLLSVHVTTAAAERNWSAWGRTYINTRNRLGLVVAEKLIYIKANYGDMELAGDELVALDVC